jgi:site-specific recombinase XerD
VPENTKRAYASDWKQFAQWCQDNGRTALPCTAETLAEYASYAADNGKKPASIMRALASVRVIHNLSGEQPPETLAARHVVKAYRSERADAGVANETRAAVLSVEQLKKMVQALNSGSAMDLRDRLIIVLGWTMMARRSELVALNIGDVTEVDSGLDVVIRKAKADQNAIGRTIGIPYASDPSVCPVRLARQWLALLAERGITAGPFFRRIDLTGRIAGEPGEEWRGRVGRPGNREGRVTGPGMWHIIKKATTRAGMEDIGIQSHSLRAGGATGAYLGGADLLSISRHGGWVDGSPIMTRYIRDIDRWQKNPMTGAGL